MKIKIKKLLPSEPAIAPRIEPAIEPTASDTKLIKLRIVLSIPVHAPAPAPALKQNFYHLKRYIEEDKSLLLYNYLKNNITWGEGIRSKKGHTRSAIAFTLDELLTIVDDFPEVVAKISEVIEKYSVRKVCDGVYLNYYKDGNDWTPNHTHPGTTQIVISLGATRKFIYGKKEIDSCNGDVLVFGATVHGVPKQLYSNGGRISIALFLVA